MRIPKSSRLPHVGKSVFDKTDPDYEANKLAKAAKEYANLDDEWKPEFLNGFRASDRNEIVLLSEKYMDKNSNNVTDRRATSPRRDTDVTKTEYPIITKSAYEQIHRNGEKFDPDLRALCLARNRLGAALSAIDVAMNKWNPQVAKDPKKKTVYNKLTSLRTGVEKSYIAFPLVVK